MNILITGTAGFIGSAFVRLLLNKTRKKYPIEFGNNGKIISLDILSYAESLENLALVKTDPRHLFFKGDICDRNLVESLVQEHKIDSIINFAAESHVDRSIESSEPFVRSNVIGTVNLLDVARKYQLKYLQVSTDEVYGTLGDTGAFTEESPLQPNSPYSASKTAADCFVRAYVETHKLHAVITRCTNNYGPYQFPEKFLPLSITRLMSHQKIPVYGSGKNVRDWIHVEDHCYGIWLAFTQGKTGEVYNFGGYGEASNIEMARKLIKIFGKNETESLEFVEDRKGHDWRYAMDPKKSKNELQWQPLWNIEEGLEDMVNWYKEYSSWWKAKS